MTYTFDEILNSFVEFNKNEDPNDYIRKIYVDDIETTYFVTCDGRIFNKYKDVYKQLKPVKVDRGYLIVLIYYKDHNGKKTRSRFYIHRLVASAFIPIPEKYISEEYDEKTLTVNHKLGKYKDFNHVTNLEWATQKDQMIHANKTGLCHPKCGEKSNFAILKNSQVIKICEALKNNEKSMVELANEYNVSRKTISMIYHKKRWKKISEKYDFSKFNKRRCCNLLNLKRAIEIMLDNKSNLSLKEISKITGIRYDYLWKINNYDDIKDFYNRVVERLND